MESERETSGGRSAEWFRFFGAARQEQKKGQPQRQRQWQRTLTARTFLPLITSPSLHQPLPCTQYMLSYPIPNINTIEIAMIICLIFFMTVHINIMM